METARATAAAGARSTPGASARAGGLGLVQCPRCLDEVGPHDVEQRKSAPAPAAADRSLCAKLRMDGVTPARGPWIKQLEQALPHGVAGLRIGRGVHRAPPLPPRLAAKPFLLVEGGERAQGVERLGRSSTARS